MFGDLLDGNAEAPASEQAIAEYLDDQDGDGDGDDD